MKGLSGNRPESSIVDGLKEVTRALLNAGQWLYIAWNHLIPRLMHVLIYFYSCTDGERTMLLSYFECANFECGIHS